MIKILLVRHGDTEADVSRYWGHSDVPLNADGRRQAEKLRDRLSAEKIEAIYSSDLKRAMDTAAVIAAARQPAVVSCPQLREIDFGQCEGLTFDEVKERYPSTESIWTEGGRYTCFPGGESMQALVERVAAFAGRLRGEPCGTALVIAHGGSLRVLICCLTGLEMSSWRRICIDRASLSIIDLDDRHGALRLLNDVSHLRETASTGERPGTMEKS